MHYYLDFQDRQTMKAIFEALIQSQKLEIWVSWDFASSITTTATFKYCEKVGTEIRVYGWLLSWLARCQKFCSFALHFSVCITFEKCCHIVHWFEISVFNPNLSFELHSVEISWLEFPKRIRILKRWIRIPFFQTIMDIRITDIRIFTK